MIAYNAMYALPFTIVPIFLLVFGDNSREMLQKISAFLEKVSGFLMPVLLFGVGALFASPSFGP